MSPKRSSVGHEESPPTLGALLDTDPPTTSIPEHDWSALVAAIAAGDPDALRALYERSHRLVFTLAMRIGGNREAAEEVTLDVFHDVWRRAARYDPAGGSVLGWIMNQARSRAIDRLRFEQRKKRVDPHPHHHGAHGAATCPPDAHEAGERRRSLERALATLTSDERQTIETAFFSGLTYAETAVRLDQPLGTIKTRVRAALAKLRRSLGTEGHGP